MSGVLKPSHKMASLISNLAYIVLNTLLALMVVVIVDLFDSPWLAIGLVVLSKWRVLAVKMRYWWANLTSNFVDFLVGLNYVLIIYQLGESQFVAQLAVAGLYLVWLLIIKPGSSQRMVMLQGLVTIFLSNVVLSIFAASWSSPFFVLAEMVIGYHVMRHFLANFNEEAKPLRLVSGIWALIMAELAWIYWHWMIGYDLEINLGISQFAIVSTLMTFVAYKVLNFTNDDFETNSKGIVIDLMISIAFAAIAILVMLMFFSKVQIS